jgi:hypothetical protein
LHIAAPLLRRPASPGPIREATDAVDVPNSVELMSDERVLATFDTSEDPAARGFDDETHTRVVAWALVRAHGRLAYYRALYAAFIEVGKPFMVENLDEEDSGGDDAPAKLIFSDDPDHVLGLEQEAAVVVWTEPELLSALVHERAVQDYFTDLLDELALAVEEP